MVRRHLTLRLRRARAVVLFGAMATKHLSGLRAERYRQALASLGGG